jgi:hypothetical protein
MFFQPATIHDNKEAGLLGAFCSRVINHALL